MQNAAVQNNKINDLVRRQVITLFREILSDSDFGLELKPEFIKRLNRSLLSKKKGKIKSLDQMLDKYKYL